jgi:hypothetical protein
VADGGSNKKPKETTASTGYGNVAAAEGKPSARAEEAGKQTQTSGGEAPTQTTAATLDIVTVVEAVKELQELANRVGGRENLQRLMDLLP